MGLVDVVGKGDIQGGKAGRRGVNQEGREEGQAQGDALHLSSVPRRRRAWKAVLIPKAREQPKGRVGQGMAGGSTARW